MRKKTLLHLLWIVMVSLGISTASTTFQTITVKVLPSTSIVITGQDPEFEVVTEPLVPGDRRVTQFKTGISYSIVCADGCTKKIIAQLDNEMPQGTYFKVYMSPPPGATTTGFQTLSTIERDLVLNVSGTTVVKNASIIYEVDVDSSVMSLAPFTRKVIYTFIDE